MIMENNIAIYWGAFNPPTIAHKKVITWILEDGFIDKIIFTPDGTRVDKNYGIDSETRKEIIREFFAEIQQEGWHVDIDDTFLERPQSTNTIEVEKHFIKILWKQPWHIFGIDVIEQMKSWIGNEDGYIENTLKKILMTREWYEIPSDTPLKVGKILDFDTPNVSSTMVREMIYNKQKVDHLLTPRVAEIITQNNILYDK